MRRNLKKPALALTAVALVGTCMAVGCAPQATNVAMDEDSSSGGATAATEAPAGDGTTLAERKAAWPAQYYSFAGDADEMDDMGG